MKTLMFASMLALTASTGMALASEITVYRDGTTYDPNSGATTAAQVQYAMTSKQLSTTHSDAQDYSSTPKVVQWGPPDASLDTP